MAIPNCREIVERLSREFPDEWRNAHSGNAHTEDFIRRLAWVLYSTVDPRFGLLGQRGNPNVIGDDVVLWTGEGPGVDPLTGKAVSAFDVIVRAGDPSQEPGWGFINQRGQAAWVRPEPVGGTGSGGGGTSPTPTPPPTPPAPDLTPLLTRLDALAVAVSTLKSAIDGVVANATTAAHESTQAAVRASEIKTQIANMPAGKPFPAYTGRFPKAFGGSSEVVLTPKE